ncbi:unnamed protein product [Prunus armeniaca]|uniref:Uncharacterized protein n=1 Tax=Prunus armeniaca TaxID=36596 RepID=A0A6J5XL74_PRUAR|nr:unnamed protein product [Prunus armeniaca]
MEKREGGLRWWSWVVAAVLGSLGGGSGCEEGGVAVVVIGEWRRRKRWFMGGGSVGYGFIEGWVGGPRRIRVCIARERNDEEYAKELYSLVTVTEVPPEGFTSLGTKVIDDEDWTELVLNPLFFLPSS